MQKLRSRDVRPDRLVAGGFEQTDEDRRDLAGEPQTVPVSRVRYCRSRPAVGWRKRF